MIYTYIRVSPVFRLYLNKEFQRLKEKEQENVSLDWSVKRMLSKVNYQIHNETVKEYLIPPRLSNTKGAGMIYASEADLLNVALYGITARQWKEQNIELKGNMRDHSSAEQLLVLANLENLNAEYIKMGLDQEQRLEMLNQTAIQQMELLIRLSVPEKIKSIKKLKPK